MSKNFAMAHAIKNMNKRKKMAKGGMVDGYNGGTEDGRRVNDGDYSSAKVNDNYLAEGGEAPEKSAWEKAKDVYYGGIDANKPKAPVKDPINMEVGRDQFEKKHAKGGMIENESLNPENEEEEMPELGSKVIGIEEYPDSYGMEHDEIDRDMIGHMMEKRKMYANGGMINDWNMPIDHDSEHEDFLSDEDDKSAGIMEDDEGKDQEDIFEPNKNNRKSIMSRVMGSLYRRR